MVARISRPLSTALRGVITAVGARWRLFITVALGVGLLDILAPILVLSLARKPVDFFTFNPWLKRLPDYLAAPQPPLIASTTPLKWMADLSAVGTSLVAGALVLGVCYLGWRAGAAARPAVR